jgi:tetratricopeptide (TPR) repeat protein
MRTLLVLFSLCLTLGIAPADSAHAQPADSLMQHGQELVDRGVTAGDEASLQQARALFKRIAAASDDAVWPHYYAGLANYRIASLFLDSDDDRADAHLDDALDHLKRAVDNQSDLAEAHALLGTVYGLKARGGMISGMRYGPKADGAMERARSLAPNNPRVILLNAVSLLNKPSRWGGDRERAMTELQRALQQFETASAPEDGRAPQWGQADAYAWLGIAHMKADQADQARDAFEQALAIRPGYTWVESGLLPQLAANE